MDEGALGGTRHAAGGGRDHGHHPVADPAEVGRWDRLPARFRYLPIHTALLHTGEVLAFGGSGNDPEHLRSPYPAEILDPVSGAITVLDQPLDGDLFCVGHCFLPDGRLLVAGGTHNYDWVVNGVTLKPFAGLDQSYAFDPATRRWSRLPDLAEGRWYPTLIQTRDDTVLCIAGLSKGLPWAFLRKAERFAGGRWRDDGAAAARWTPLYPRLHLLPDGDVFYAGAYNTHYVYPFALRAFPPARLKARTRAWEVVAAPRVREREEGATVLLPLQPPYDRASILLIGGGEPLGASATAATERIDFSDGATPTWVDQAPMAHPRYYCYPVLLPDGEVLVFGGKSGKEGHQHEGPPGTPDPDGNPPQDPLAIRHCEIFADGRWRPAAPIGVDRLYHSGGLLLPDGRVLATGSNPARKCNELRIEIYSPPYLFRGPRPQILSSPNEVRRGSGFEVGYASESAISKVVLVRQASTTHCFSTEQRSVELAVTTAGEGRLRAQLPRSGAVLPSGYYMLFLLADGVPSVARFLRVAPEASA